MDSIIKKYISKEKSTSIGTVREILPNQYSISKIGNDVSFADINSAKIHPDGEAIILIRDTNGNRIRGSQQADFGVSSDDVVRIILNVIDISSDTNLTVSAPLKLTGDNISLDYDFTDFQLDGDTLQIKNNGIVHNELYGLTDGDPHTQYYNIDRLVAWFQTKDTDDLAEGVSNLYFPGFSDLETDYGFGDPGADRIFGWDDTDGTLGYFTIGANLSYDHATHTLSATGGGMVYPSAGISRSTGIAWDTSITDNSADWDAIAGWLVTPPPVSNFTNDAGYLSVETDPIFGASAASGIVAEDLTDWDTGYTHSQLTSGNPHNVIASEISVTDTPDYFNGLTVETVLAEIGANWQAEKELTGFPNLTDTSLSWDDGIRTLTITGTNYNVWLSGKKYTLNTDTSQIPDVTGLYFFYIDTDGDFKNTNVFPGWDKGFVAFVYWNSTLGKGLTGEERHGFMPNTAHTYLHNYFNTRYGSGLVGVFGNTTFSVDSGVIADEDIVHTLSAQTTCDILYKDGSADYKWLENQTAYYYSSGGNLYYNNGNVLTAVPVNQYVAYWIHATNSLTRPIVALMGQRVDTTLANARDNNGYQSLVLETLPFKEMKLLYRVILRNDATPYQETQDLRSVLNVSSGTFLATIHSALSGRSDPDSHPAEAISVDSSVFAGNLSIADVDVQAALETIDQLSIPVVLDRIRQATIPTPAVGEAIIWSDDDDGDKFYFVYNDFDGGVGAIEFGVA